MSSQDEMIEEITRIKMNHLLALPKKAIAENTLIKISVKS